MKAPWDYGPRRPVIESVTPQVDGGRFPVKRVVGETVVVEADIFADGHDVLDAVLRYRSEEQPDWDEVPLSRLHNDRWRGDFLVGHCGEYRYTLQAWIDHFASWRRDFAKRIEAEQELSVPLQTGAALVEAATARAHGEVLRELSGWAARLAGTASVAQRSQWALDKALEQAMRQCPDRQLAVSFEPELRVSVEPLLARFSTWYELFPRSSSRSPGRHGTFGDCAERLPQIAAMGFDVVYLPPIHPIGETARKGPNNVLSRSEDDPGSPWAIGASSGGHMAIHPQLGTLEDFQQLVREAAGHGLAVALDIAFQCSPDHPWVQQHPEWFRRRPDGSIQYAENPPKKYQDIYPFDFESEDWPGLWQALREVFLFWVAQGVTVFRVDNPHTKSLYFWEWVIAEIKREEPDTIFLAEAFTRPKLMRRLAKAGFSQSYNYFPWRNTKWELTQYLTELTQHTSREYFRPNLWPNTPDILPEYLQIGGRPAFAVRLVLAATLGANYGIYGPAFELFENRPLAPGSEEYLDSEKYQIRHWETARRDSLGEFISRVNRIRRENPALQSDWSLQFHPVDNDQLIAYSKRDEATDNAVLVVVNLDPHHAQSGWLELPLAEFGMRDHQPYQMHDLLGGARYLWNGPRNYVQLDPALVAAHVFRLRRRVRTEHDFDYYF